MYVRVKRLKTTSFLHVEPTDTIGSVKAKLQDLLQQAPERQQLYKDGTLLEDDRSLAELKVETDDALTLVLQQEDGSWESPQVVNYDDGGNEES
ncbi:putative Polyubiquitin-B [Nannochloris sp. 'desiccata']|nr:hypothetical protein KSW81_007663 [Chlorella desiccata (nom. nud.)]KAH7618907.1 putative Polyubiquitin-B [Chlorella desiccata (nom. nud.)]